MALPHSSQFIFDLEIGSSWEHIQGNKSKSPISDKCPCALADFTFKLKFVKRLNPSRSSLRLNSSNLLWSVFSAGNCSQKLKNVKGNLVSLPRRRETFTVIRLSELSSSKVNDGKLSIYSCHLTAPDTINMLTQTSNYESKLW